MEEDGYEISQDNPEVRLGYSSGRNISFRGTIPTGISRNQWGEMSSEDQDEIIQDLLNELVDVYELNDDESDVY